MRRGFYFNSINNTYFYNDVNGNVSSEINKKGNDILYGNEKYVNKHITDDEVQNTFNIIGVSQLTLIVTEECNLRCKYCVYSGEYHNNRIHSSNYMNKEIAEKAVNKYLECVKKDRRKNINKNPVIGFFGGEPLLNFDLIKHVVEYSKNIYKGKISYTITTNATLLDKEKIDFLVKNQFSLIISLNGNKYENDRLRVYPNNNGTYNTILEKLKIIYNEYPIFFDSNVKISTIFDNGTNLFELRDFFKKNVWLSNKLIILSKVIELHTNWYDRYSKEENKMYHLQLKELKDNFYNNLLSKNYSDIDIVSKKLFSIFYLNILNRATNIKMDNYKFDIQPFSGSCIPGTKISVDYQGLLHMCEKVNNSVPIGNIEKWIDYEKISNLLNKYNSYIGSKCINCPVQRLCTICYKDIININGNCDFNQSNWCKLFIKEQRILFGEIYSLLENGLTVKEIFQNLI